MTMQKLIKIILFCCLIISSSAYAALDLELTQGVDQAIPIAITAFSSQDQLSTVISNDLQNSGRFKVDYMNKLTSADDINYSAWRNKKIDYLVLGSMDAGKLNFQLVDVDSKTVLLNQSFNVPQEQLRALAHHISDLIYKQLTGQRGVFSTKIAYVLVQHRQNKTLLHKLMVADADGFNPEVLLTSIAPIMSPAWSPDGKQIAYVSFEKNHAAIYVQDLATGERKLITQFPGINGAPAWSPDGSKLALVLTKTGYPKIYLLDLQSKKLQQITRGWSLDTEPAWSPDGKKIIFTSNRGGEPQIYQVHLSTNKIERLTYQGNYNARAEFTADGKSIVMLHREDNMFNIAMMDLTSGDITLLTNSGMDESPSVAPSGNMVVYATNYGGRGILAEVSTDGNVKLRLPAQEGEVQDPAWSPFLN